MLRRLCLVLIVMVLALLPALPHSPLAPQPAQAAITTFTSSSGIGVGRGAGNPYPPTISVPSFDRSVMHVSMTLIGLSYRNSLVNLGCNWDLLDIMLAGPDGQRVMLMSDVARDGNTSDSQRTLTFDDNAMTGLPTSGSFTSGTYAPTDVEPGELMPAPAPAGPYAGGLSVFANTDSDGLWSLYIASERATNGCQGG